MLELFQYTKTEVCYILNGLQAYRFSEGLTDFSWSRPGPTPARIIPSLKMPLVCVNIVWVQKTFQYAYFSLL